MIIRKKVVDKPEASRMRWVRFGHKYESKDLLAFLMVPVIFILLHLFSGSKWGQDDATFFELTLPGQFEATMNPDGTVMRALNDEWELGITFIGLIVDDITIPTDFDDVRMSKNQVEFNRGVLTIEYLKTPSGLRQNFIVDKVSDTFSPSEIAVHLGTDGLTPSKGSDNEVIFYDSQRDHQVKYLTYNKLKVWDATGRILEAKFEVIGDLIKILVNARDVIYPITIDPLATTAAWMMEGDQAGSEAGTSVKSVGDVNGDGYSDVIVGVPLYDNGQIDEGRSYVYFGSSDGPSASVSWTGEIDQANALFGSSVSNAGDVNGDGYGDFIVGAPGEDKVYGYYGSASGPGSSPDWSVSSSNGSQSFGASVSLAGDVNGDGYSDVIIGEPGYSNVFTNQGKVSVFYGGSTGLSSSPATVLEGPSMDARFGQSVSGAGNVNGDIDSGTSNGFSDVIVGTDNDEVYLLYGSSSGLGNQLVLSGPDNFGISVGGAGDVNGDGYSDVIVGGNLYANGHTDEGFVRLYYGSASGLATTPGWEVESDIVSGELGEVVGLAGDVNGDGYSDVAVSLPGAEKVAIYHGSSAGPATTVELSVSASGFGKSLFSAGDVNGDGISDIIVGAPLLDGLAGVDTGGAYIYLGSPGSVSDVPILLEENIAGSSIWGNFAYSVSGAGDVNGDGYNDVIVGTSNNGSSNPSSNDVYIYHGSMNGISTVYATKLEPTSAPFSATVSGVGDVNGDGFDDVIVGGSNLGSGSEGLAYVYHGSPTGVSISYEVILEENNANSRFGRFVSGAGDVNGDGYSDVIIAGNQGDTAYVYHGSSTGILSVSQSKFALDVQVSSVSGAGDVNGDGYSDVIVGRERFTNGQTREGLASVYLGSPSGLSPTAHWEVESDVANAYFGSSVSGAGDVNGDGFDDIVVGAYGNFNKGLVGYAYVYHGSASGLLASYQEVLTNNSVNARFGRSVSGAGDVNGDGYSDVIIGSDNYANGQSAEGAAYLYVGSPSGLTLAAEWESDQASAFFGLDVAGVGDVTGDGYSDVIVGAFLYDNGQADEGVAFVYEGNNGNSAIRKLDLYNASSTDPLEQGIKTDDFGIGLFVTNWEGRTKGKLVWEVKGKEEPFDGTPITNSTFITEQQSSYSDLEVSGSELTTNVDKISRSTKVRARVSYHPVTSLSGQVFGQWTYPQAYFNTGGASLPLPVELLFVKAIVTEAQLVKILWATASETNNKGFEIEKSSDGIDWTYTGYVEGNGTTSESHNYSFTDPSPPFPNGYYRLKQIDFDGAYEYSKIVSVKGEWSDNVIVYPNPFEDHLTMTGVSAFELYTLGGQMIVKAELDETNEYWFRGLKKGTYILRTFKPGNVKNNQQLVIKK